MSTKIGRVTLRDPERCRVVPRRVAPVLGTLKGGVRGSGYFEDEAYSVEGHELGANATIQSTMDALLKEAKRPGAVYCSSDEAAFPSGYYELEVQGDLYEKPPGGPSWRPWKLLLAAATEPDVYRQAESDNAQGTDTDDLEAEEEKYVAYAPTTSYVTVLDPRNVSGAEKFDLPWLPDGYRCLARIQVRTTVTAVLRALLDDSGGTALVTGSDKTYGTAGEWTELDLGTFVVPKANTKANWFRVQVRDPTNVNPVWLDRARWVPA